ncbi:hypothetical protein NVP1121O_063 [Vibrio phage 1.121.O._10N.286.46.C4]|nr:hypothetical protein NVP1121O_063 [Vibrio phage 1.121.O._10N.286.46.C4]
MAQILDLQSTNTLGDDDQTIVRQGNIDKRISLQLSATLSWAKRKGFTHLGEHTVGVTFNSATEFTTYQGKAYFTVRGVNAGYVSMVADPSTDTSLTVDQAAEVTEDRINEKTWYDWGTNSLGGNTSIAEELYAFGSGSSRVIVYDPAGGNVMGSEPSYPEFIVIPPSNSLFVPASSTADEAQSIIQQFYEREDIAMLVFDQNGTLEIDKALFFNSYPDGTPSTLTRGGVIVMGKIKLTAQTGGGSATVWGRGADVGNKESVERTGNLVVMGGVIDGDNIAGENGWSIDRAECITFINPRAVNCKRDYVGTREGGRAMTIHARSKGVYVQNLVAENCSDYIHLAPEADTKPSDAGNVAITSITQDVQAVITATGHNFTVGDFAAIYNCSGMTEINPSYSSDAFYEVVSVNGGSFTIDLDTTTFGVYTGNGRTVVADTTDAGKNTGVVFDGGYAEGCEYSVINIESANQPRTTRAIQTLTVKGIVAKNCGTTATRGMINGSTGCRLVGDITLVNDSVHPVNSIIRGSFQGSDFSVYAELTNINRAFIDASPTDENPAGSGIDAGYPSFPYGCSFDNDITLTVKYKNTVQSGVDAMIWVDDNAGSSIDNFYRNKVDITVTGLPDNVGVGIPFSNVGLHNTNRLRIHDQQLNRVVIGYPSDSRTFTLQANTIEHIGVQSYADTEQYVKGTAFSRYNFTDASGARLGGLEYNNSNNRLYFRVNGFANRWQMTDTTLMPTSDGVTDIASAGLRVDTIHLVNAPSVTSTRLSKTNERGIPEAVIRAVRAVPFKCFEYIESIQKKGGTYDEIGSGGARSHVNPIIEDIIAAFEAEGIDPWKYAVIRKVSWEYEPEVTDDEGDILQPELLAGERLELVESQWLALKLAAAGL